MSPDTPRRVTRSRGADDALSPLRDRASQLEEGWRATELARLETDLRDADAQLRRAALRIAELEAANAALMNTVGQASARAVARLRRAARTLAPAQTRREVVLRSPLRLAAALRREGARGLVRCALRSGAQTASGQPDSWMRAARRALAPPLGDSDRRWNQFVDQHEPDGSALQAMRAAARALPTHPLISILIPAPHTEVDALRSSIESVFAQVYENWQLCIVHDLHGGGTPTELSGYAADARLRLSHSSPDDLGRSAIAAAALADGDYLAFVGVGDTLAPHALHEVVQHILAHPESDVVYSDEDGLDAWDRRVAPRLKPDWSPELLESCDYFGHLTVLRRSLYDEVGGLRDADSGAEHFDLALRASERARRVGRVGEALYHRRLPNMPAHDPAATLRAGAAARGALERAMQRRGESAQVESGPRPLLYRIRREVLNRPTVGVVIPTRNRAELLTRSLACLAAESVPGELRVVIVDNGSTEAVTRRLLENSPHSVIRAPGAFNFAYLVNLGVQACGDADHVLLLNNDVVSGSPGWLGALLEHSQRPEVGAVGARLLLPDGRVQHEGDGVGVHGDPAVNLDLSGYLDLGVCVRTVSAVTGACLMVKRKAWAEVGGFDERLRVAYNDVDFCLRLRQAGYRNVYTPLAEMTHAVSASRGGHVPRADVELFLSRWDPIHQGYDPYVGRHIWSFQPLDFR